MTLPPPHPRRMALPALGVGFLAAMGLGMGPQPHGEGWGGADLGPLQASWPTLSVLGIALLLLAWQWLRGRRLRRVNLQLEQRVLEGSRELQACKEGYRLLSENGGEVIWLVDRETLAVEYLSPSAERVLGITPERAKNQSITTLHPAVGRAFRAEVQGVVEQLGPLLLLRKPFSLDELREALRQASAGMSAS